MAEPRAIDALAADDRHAGLREELEGPAAQVRALVGRAQGRDRHELDPHVGGRRQGGRRDPTQLEPGGRRARSGRLVVGPVPGTALVLVHAQQEAPRAEGPARGPEGLGRQVQHHPQLHRPGREGRSAVVVAIDHESGGRHGLCHGRPRLAHGRVPGRARPGLGQPRIDQLGLQHRRPRPVAVQVEGASQVPGRHVVHARSLAALEAPALLLQGLARHAWVEAEVSAHHPRLGLTHAHGKAAGRQLETLVTTPEGVGHRAERRGSGQALDLDALGRQGPGQPVQATRAVGPRDPHAVPVGLVGRDARPARS